jgi:hypothetical protein
VVSLAIPIVRSVLSTFPQQSSQVCVSHSFTEHQSVFSSDSYQWQASPQHSSRHQEQSCENYIIINFHVNFKAPVERIADPSGRAVCGRSHAGIAGSNFAWGMDVCLL